MTVHLVITAVKWLNAFPFKGGVSDNRSPAKIIDGCDYPDLKVKRITFGSYVLLYTGTKNNMNRPSTPVIGLSQSNQTGGHFFVSLHTVKRLHGNKWEGVHFDDEVIKRAGVLAENEK